MPGAIHNYWLGIMALSFAVALATWIGLVFFAGRHPGGQAQESWPRRDVMGGSFTASEGGRQVMPDPVGSAEAESEPGERPAEQVPAAPSPAARAPAPREPVEPEPKPEPAQTPAPRDSVESPPTTVER
jgi:cell division septation protein DedD